MYVGFLKFVAICISAFLLISWAFTQKSYSQKLYPIQINEKWGYINEKGKIVIQPQFDEAERFSEGLALVSIGLNDGFIDAKGKLIIEPIYRCSHGFSEGLAAVAKDCEGNWEYIDRNGKTVIEPKFSWAGQFRGGLAEVLFVTNEQPFDQKTGYIDKSGKFIIEPKFDSSEPFSDGLAMIAEDKKREDGSSAYFNRKAFMDTKGNIVTPFFDRAEDFSDGLAAVEINNLWGFIDKTGNIVIAPQFDFIVRGFSEGIAFVNCDNDKIAAINKIGKYITECFFSEAWSFSEGLAPVQIGEKFGYINKTGKFTIEPQFDSAKPFYNGLAEVHTYKDDWFYTGYINHSGRYVFKPVKSRKLDD